MIDFHGKGVDSSSTRILPVGTTIITARGTVGKCALVGSPMAMNQSCYGIKSKYDFTDNYVYFTVLGIIDLLKQNVHGSVFDTITRDTIYYQKIIIPNSEMMIKYNERSLPIFKMIRKNVSENITLAKTRDTLLPKLMTGDWNV